MGTTTTISQAELMTRLSSVAGCRGGTSTMPDDHTVAGTLTAIKAKWLLGGRSVTNQFTCTLDPATHTTHFRESAVESSWGLPPPTFTVETRSQYGTRVTTKRRDAGVGGGGILEFGTFREDVEQAVHDAGWTFVYEAV